MNALEEIYTLCLEKHFPFAAFQYPGNSRYDYVIQLSNPVKIKESDDITALEGFIFVPFNQNYQIPSILISPDLVRSKSGSDHLIIHKLIESKSLIPEKYPSVLPYFADMGEYMDNVNEIRRRIGNGEFQKAILSRTILEKRPASMSNTDLFLQMCKKYHSSFISFVHIPGYATWIGASPELLLSHRDHLLTLVSLAGTQVKPKNNLVKIKWDEKCLVEQKIVTDYLIDLFNEFNIGNYQKEGPATVHAGEIVHLKTTFTLSDTTLNGHTGEFVKKLHPTPAVWGQPKTDALNIIIELEKYNREYYAGYLGPVNLSGNVDLFVNLRTMKIIDDQLIIYVGSGITAGSDPQEEWYETCMKARTILSIINP